MGIYGFIGMKVKSISRRGSRRINKMGTIGKAGTENQDFGRTTYEYSLEGELYLYSFTDFSDVTDLADDLAVQYAIEYCYLTRTPLLLISDIDTELVAIANVTPSPIATALLSLLVTARVEQMPRTILHIGLSFQSVLKKTLE